MLDNRNLMTIKKYEPIIGKRRLALLSDIDPKFTSKEISDLEIAKQLTSLVTIVKCLESTPHFNSTLLIRNLHYTTVLTKKEYLEKYPEGLELIEEDADKFAAVLPSGSRYLVMNQSLSLRMLAHELLHLCNIIHQTLTDKTIYVNGFLFDVSYNFEIGKGLNEGTTCLLTTKLFCDNATETEVYACLEHAVARFSNLVDFDNIKRYYSEANLLGLIESQEIDKPVNVLRFCRYLDDFYYKNPKNGRINDAKGFYKADKLLTKWERKRI